MEAMNCRTFLTCLLVAPAVLALVRPLPAAKATKTPVAGKFVVKPGEGDSWIDDEGIWHTRGAPAALEFIDGDLGGTGVAIVNVNLNLMTWDGDESGSVTMELTLGSLSGTFEGRLSNTYTAGAGAGHGVYHGTGDFAGMKLMINTSFSLLGGVPFEVSYWGIILDPHGG
jgi:hypothetical protein